MKSDRVNLVAPASPVHRARKFKCTMAARELHFKKGIILILQRTKEMDNINLLILGFTTLKFRPQDSFKYLGSGLKTGNIWTLDGKLEIS